MNCVARLTIIALALVGSAAGAQGIGGRPRDGAGAGRQGLPRQQMEARLRQGLWRVVKQRVGLDNEQMGKLEQVNQRFDQRRRALNQDERSQRLSLRAEVVAGDAANQDRIAASLDRLYAVQRQRLDLHVEEQREYARFMTPLQRAKLSAIQEQLRRRAENLRRSRTDSQPEF